MFDKYEDVAEKYDFTLQGTVKGRGALILDTNQGLKALKEYRGSGKHLIWSQAVLEKIDMDKIDRYQSKDYRIDPAHDIACSLILPLFPPFPRNEACSVNINYEWYYKHTHPAFHPKKKSDIKRKIYTHFNERLASCLHSPA